MEYDRQRHRDGYAAGVPAYNRPRKPRARAEAYGVAYVPINREQIFERDSWTCGICSLRVDRTLEYPDPDCATIDHVVPWAAFGPHTPDNVQCAHLVCNLRKGQKVPDNA
ncbi:HNH endonuclease [Pseudarthrobacter cellobiosi]|uniref:HNH endonuclease n=1 Tax=Pseudarthrobacter cellobiosi TaxID=2953654 RepID=UPI0035ABE02C